MQAAIALVTALRNQWKRRPTRCGLPAWSFRRCCSAAWRGSTTGSSSRRTRNDVATATNAIAEHAQTVVETVDLVIARVQDHIDRQSWASLATSRETHDFLDRLRRELPQVEAVFLVDPNGIIAASSRAYPMPRYDVHGAEYLRRTKAQDNDAMVVSAPFLGAISGTKGSS